jgi:hypothetical protein
LVECVLPVVGVRAGEAEHGCFGREEAGTNVDVKVGGCEGGSVWDLAVDGGEASRTRDGVCEAVQGRIGASDGGWRCGDA